ncbi:MAG TPA: (Na+)-NQR maturation NqrM [Planctomycetaceae bacterium]|nr:(Na+)-NQR maturation NqrM [Planctomycetaceae bacterium]
MMNNFLIALGVFLVAVIGMAIGVIFSNKRIKGSCGGLASMKDSQGQTICDVCTHPSPDCTGNPELEDCPVEEVTEEKSTETELV